MSDLQIVIAALFVSAAGLNALANWLKVPYPIPLVIGGLVLGLVPGIPDIQLDPDLVLLVFLPPLLYSAAFFARPARRCATTRASISLSAIGLVLATTAAVAVIGHELIDLPWAMAFALGAIVSPTDPAAATAIMRRVGAPRRMVNVLEGESLFNDATALVAYKVAVAAAVGASVSAGHTVLEFLASRPAAGSRSGSPSAGSIAEVRRRVDRHQHRAHDLAVQRLRRVRPGRRARRLGRPGRRHLRRLPRLARARDRHAGEPDAGLRACGRSSRSCSTPPCSSSSGCSCRRSSTG